MRRVLTLTFLLSCCLALSPDGKCRVLVLRGGGVHGAYEVGALQALVEHLEPKEYAYDFISGVSIGALNAGVIAKYK